MRAHFSYPNGGNMLIEVIVIGLLVQAVLWKKISLDLDHLKTMLGILALLLVLRFIIRLNPQAPQTIYRLQGPLIIGLSLLLVRQKPRLGFILFSIGLFLNGLMLALYGRMPVDPSALVQAGQESVLKLLIQNQSTSHCLMTGGLQAYLGDWIPLPKAYPLARVISPGDILMSLGLVYLLILQPIEKEMSHD